MKFKRNVRFRGLKRYHPEGGIDQDFTCEKEVEFDLSAGCLNRPIISLEIEGVTRYFVFASAETAVWNYDEVPAPIHFNVPVIHDDAPPMFGYQPKVARWTPPHLYEGQPAKAPDEVRHFRQFSKFQPIRWDRWVFGWGEFMVAIEVTTDNHSD